jgi:hypothetical protein
MSNADSGSEEMAGSTTDKYSSVSQAMKLVHQTFNGDKSKLKGLTDNVSTASS